MRIGSRPMPRDRRAKDMAPPVAIIVLDGMQSQRLAAPPTMSRSIRVTSAPSRAAWVAAVVPAGPPPMMTKCSGIAAKGYCPPGPAPCSASRSALGVGVAQAGLGEEQVAAVGLGGGVGGPGATGRRSVRDRTA